MDIIPVAINPCKNQPATGINAIHHGTNGTNIHTKIVIIITGIHSYLNSRLNNVENKNDFNLGILYLLSFYIHYKYA